MYTLKLTKHIMEENLEINIVENKNIEDKENVLKIGLQQIAGAIIISGIIIAGAILIKGNNNQTAKDDPSLGKIQIAKLSQNDRVIGNPNAKVTLVMYEDFQCPFCGKFFSESESVLRDNYIKKGTINYAYRDFTFLGPESVQAGQAARCAGDQNKFWEYHDYLFSHQNGENKGNFSDTNLKLFAKNLQLNYVNFDQCLDTGKYLKAITDSKTEAQNAGVNSTPKGFILKNGKIVDTIDGAEPIQNIVKKLDTYLK